MFELEVNHETISSDELGKGIRHEFQSLERSIQGVTLLPWEEHCTECAMPGCYESCDLYEPRKDGKCRRFIGGIVPVQDVSATQNQIVRVAFKRWGQLLTYANLHMVPLVRAKRIEQTISAVESIVSRIPDAGFTILGRRSLSSRLTRRLKRFVAAGGYFRGKAMSAPDYFLAEIYNPNRFVVNVTFKIFNTEPSKQKYSYQKLLVLESGINRYKFDFEDIAKEVDIKDELCVVFTPNILEKSEEGLCLYFGNLTFVWDDSWALRQSSSKNKVSAKKKDRFVKVVAWDLDNTVWDGVLVEDGPENLKLKPGIKDIIRKLDERGILNTVVSKNNAADALAQLHAVGLSDYILHPKIGWGQKSQYLKSLVAQFNVGEDTFAFIDDSPFERDEALALNPKMLVYDASVYNTLLERDEFNPPISTDSNRRRDFYRFEEERGEALSSFQGEYLSFLKDCQLQLNIYTPDSSNIDRIQELVQRTNQLNFSGNRYRRHEIEKILSDPGYETYSMDSQDKYGQYGTVGFAIVDRNASRLTDVMFSCRVQSKRIEHAFLTFLLTRYKKDGRKSFSAVYNRTDRNAKAGEVFEDFGFSQTSCVRNLRIYEFDLGKPIPDDKVVSVLWNGRVC